MGNRTSIYRKSMSRNTYVECITPPSDVKPGPDAKARQGRKFQTLGDSILWFSNRDDEVDRLVCQHFALKALFQGNVLQKTLDLVPLDEDATVLEVGCGPGTWIMDMATEFPASNFVGVDVCDMFPNEIRPPNVTFEHTNVLDHLPFPANTFDLIHVSHLMLGLRATEWPNALKELHRVLKPGGCIQSIESGLLESSNNAFVTNASQIFTTVMSERGLEPCIVEKIKPLMEKAGFNVVERQVKTAAIGRPESLSKEFLWNIRSIFKNGEKFLSESLGVEREDYGKFLDELVNSCNGPADIVWPWAIVVAQKPITA